MANTIFDNLNGKKLVIGLVHLLPMPGTPLYQEGNLEKMTEKAIADCKALQNAGADGGLIQSVDVYYPATDDTDYARVATIAMIAGRVRAEVGPDFKIGVQLMWNCITPSLAACKAAGADFTRCTALAASADSPYGRTEANPLKVAEYRNKICAGNIGMISEISGYHFKGEYSKSTIQQLAAASMRLGANAIEIMNKDFEMNERLVRDVKEAGNFPVILGGGTSVENCKERLRSADGALVGTAFEGGKWGGPIIEAIVADYVKHVRELEKELGA